MPPTIESFAPLARPDAYLLILGSMPGVASLRAEQYYAHPQNLFWKFMGEILGFDPALPYAQRIDYLQQAGIAVWDVLASCQRPGSLDADIHAASAQANDFASFLAAHPGIKRICFNGTTAEAMFRRHALPQLAHYAIETLRLPSTSPANASIPRSQKLEAWRQGLRNAITRPAQPFAAMRP